MLFNGQPLAYSGLEANPSGLKTRKTGVGYERIKMPNSLHFGEQGVSKPAKVSMLGEEKNVGAATLNGLRGSA